MKQARRYVLRLSAAWLCSFVCLLIIYLPAASISFAHHDQFRYFMAMGPEAAAQKAPRSSDPYWNWLWLLGRPIAAELEHQVFERVDTVSDLTGVRVICIGLYAAAMAILVCYLLELKLTACVAFCLAGAVFALPAVQFTVYMALLNHPVADILALVGALLMRLGTRSSAGGKPWYFNWRRIACPPLSVALLVIAQLSYPACVFTALFPITAEIALKGIAGWPATRRHLCRDVVLLAISCVVYFLMIRHYYVSQGGHRITEYQVQINSDVTERVYRFWLDLRWLILNLWNVHASVPVGRAVACLLASGLMVMVVRQLAHAYPRTPAAIWASMPYGRFFQRLGRSAQLVGTVALVLLLSETTYFASPVAWMLYRLHFAVAGIVVLLLAGSAASWGRLLAARWRTSAAMGVACTALCGAGLVAHHNVLTNCLSDSLEMSYICSQISAHVGGPIRRIHVIQPEKGRFGFVGSEVVRSSDEFNVPTSEQTGSVGYQVQTALQAVFDRASLRVCCPPHTPQGIQEADNGAIAVTYSAPGQPVVSSPDTILIDMNDLLRVASPVKRPWRAAPPLTSADLARQRGGANY